MKTILVTGCSAGGIGAAICLALARRGHNIIATARTPSKIPEEISTLSNVLILDLDVTSDESVVAAVKAVSENGRQLDVLVNNAGVGYSTPVLDMDIERARGIYETNVWGCVRMIQAFKDLLISSRGRIVNVSTCGAVINTPWTCPPSPSSFYAGHTNSLISCIYLIESRPHHNFGYSTPGACPFRRRRRYDHGRHGVQQVSHQRH